MQNSFLGAVLLVLFNVSIGVAQSSNIVYLNIDTLYSYWIVTKETNIIRSRVLFSFETDFKTKLKQLQQLISYYESDYHCNTWECIEKVRKYLRKEESKITELEGIYKYWIDNLDDELKNVEKKLLLTAYTAFTAEYGYSMIIDSSDFLYSSMDNSNVTRDFHEFLNKTIEYELILQKLYEIEHVITRKGLDEGSKIEIKDK